MKRLKLILFLPLFLAVISSCGQKTVDGGPSMQVIIDKNGDVSRFAGEQGDNYIGSIQDDFVIPKSEAKLEIWKASDGKGVVYARMFGEFAVFEQASEDSPVLFSVIYEEGYVPCTYKCLGYSDGWFHIADYDNISGFISEELVFWDAIDSF